MWRAARAERFGDVVTCDHIILRKHEHELGVGEDKRTALSILDVATKFMACYPLPNKSAEATVVALRHVVGPQRVKLLYTDGSEEIRKGG